MVVFVCSCEAWMIRPANEVGQILFSLVEFLTKKKAKYIIYASSMCMSSSLGEFDWPLTSFFLQMP
ncbi:hypothetical protein HanRHA438_Chr16g0778991 [Helianthus annuus]|nr:hypothetical protein HanRHA438_Chr16g0778991 [Helianthus annuus]